MILTGIVEFAGRGLHGGGEGSVRLLPAEPGSSIRFRLGGEDVLLGDLQASGAGRSTTLSDPRSGVSVRGVEHLLAAMAGLGLWDAIVDVEGSEIPVLDGSARPFAEAMDEASAPCDPCPPAVLARPLSVHEGEARLEAVPSESLVLDVRVEFENPHVGRQEFVWREGSPLQEAWR